MAKSANETKRAAAEFASYWEGKGSEKGDSQKFWLSLLRDVLGVEHPEQHIEFEDKVKLDHTSFIDGYIEETKVLIEQKGTNRDLDELIKQSDGTYLTPFQQAIRYSMALKYSKIPRWIVTCNFRQFNVYDREAPDDAPEVIELKDLAKEYYRLMFLVDNSTGSLKKEMEVSMAAGELVGLLYDALLKQYNDPKAPESLKSLNMLCVRIVFCLYAEDAGIFGTHTMFHDYMAQFNARDWRKALIELFKVLDETTEARKKRDPYMPKDLAAFPYVNGGLFADEDIEIPNFTDEIIDIILRKASEDFDWSEISPTIFGAVFESTINPETRHKGGMHFTPIENIHKVIDPLFLDALKEELDTIKEISVRKTRDTKLKAFQSKLARLTFLDPASGSGNFLTESYLSIRRLENDVIKTLSDGQMFIGEAVNPIQCSIQQFFGIEINDFAVAVAKTALWIAESQMMKETEDIMRMELDFLPLRTNAHIIEGNALRMDWNSVVPKGKLNYIMGNPPFIGARRMSAEQKADLNAVSGKRKGAGNLDYVSAWYMKAADYMYATGIKAAFVSTSSIAQGEQPEALWKSITDRGARIIFAHRTFKWESQATDKAAVHCVIIGFAYDPPKQRTLFMEDGQTKKVDTINAYLVEAPDIYITNRSKPLQDMPKAVFGNMPNDGGFLSEYDEEAKDRIIKQYPKAAAMIKPFAGATEFLYNKPRYCLWLKGISPEEIKAVPPVYDAVAKVKKMRQDSSREATRRLADTPALFGEIRQPESNYLLIPRHSSENRSYIPLGYESSEVICGDSNILIPDASLYMFGILTSDTHMSWVRAVCGRLESRYRYSSGIVYNNFPWPDADDRAKDAIGKTAKAILDARDLYPDSSLASLYDDNLMPPELVKAHKDNDKAVRQAYGFTKDMDEGDIVAELMKLYRKKADEDTKAQKISRQETT